MTFAHQQLRSFVDRVLALKKRQDDLNEDIKQVYSEAHAVRFDKTAMGKVVNHLRRHAKAGTKAQIADATFDEYLHAYEHGTELANNSSGAHPHAGEGAAEPEPDGLPLYEGEIYTRRQFDPYNDRVVIERRICRGGKLVPLDHDPTTGELIDDVPAIGPATGPKHREGVPGDHLRDGEIAGPSEEGGSCALGASPSSHSIPQSGAPLTPDAPGSSPGPVPVETPGAPLSGEMPDLPAFLDRRSAA